VDTVIAFTANYLLFVMAAAAGAVWLFREDRTGKTKLAVAGVLGLAFVFVLIKTAAYLHANPRPFVQNPALHPLIKHSADNGFPSDHSAVAGFITTLVALRHRLYGAGLAAAAMLVATARVAAHVHHIQDVLAGLALGMAAGWLGILLAVALMTRLSGRVSPVREHAAGV
jgi:membrane-associated phospholipid phosphatase